MNARRERFKKAMSRFEPSGDPAEALKAGLYVEVPGQSIAARTLALLELRPRSSHLLAGPSGAGKTMQLRVLERNLRESEDLEPIFIDATAEKSELQVAGKLIEHLARHLQARQRELKAHEPQKRDDGSIGTLIVLGLLLALAGQQIPQIPKLSAEDPMRTIQEHRRKPVLLLDSLDRLPIDVFVELCREDLSKLMQHIAVVVVGPPGVMYGAARELVDRFDYFARQPTYDPAHGTEMHAFLRQIVRQRADEALIPDESCVPLIEASGGVVRDLISLAQLALEESYVAGHSRVETADVRRAIDTFGRKHIIGLDSRELELLQRLRRTGAFVRVDDRDVSLLVTRRVLEYADETGAPTFAVHPALVPLLDQMGDA